MRHHERRRERRNIVRWPSVLFGDWGGKLHGEVCDISQHGAFMRIDAKRAANRLECDARVAVDCHSWQGRRVLHGRVAWVGWSNEHWCEGVGLELTDYSFPTAGAQVVEAIMTENFLELRPTRLVV